MRARGIFMGRLDLGPRGLSPSAPIPSRAHARTLWIPRTAVAGAAWGERMQTQCTPRFVTGFRAVTVCRSRRAAGNPCENRPFAEIGTYAVTHSHYAHFRAARGALSTPNNAPYLCVIRSAIFFFSFTNVTETPCVRARYNAMRRDVLSLCARARAYSTTRIIVRYSTGTTVDTVHAVA
jgi:hypothetical protein